MEDILLDQAEDSATKRAQVVGQAPTPDQIGDKPSHPNTKPTRSHQPPLEDQAGQPQQSPDHHRLVPPHHHCQTLMSSPQQVGKTHKTKDRKFPVPGAPARAAKLRSASKRGQTSSPAIRTHTNGNGPRTKIDRRRQANQSSPTDIKPFPVSQLHLPDGPSTSTGEITPTSTTRNSEIPESSSPKQSQTVQQFNKPHWGLFGEQKKYIKYKDTSFSDHTRMIREQIANAKNWKPEHVKSYPASVNENQPFMYYPSASWAVFSQFPTLEDRQIVKNSPHYVPFGNEYVPHEVARFITNERTEYCSHLIRYTNNDEPSSYIDEFEDIEVSSDKSKICNWDPEEIQRKLEDSILTTRSKIAANAYDCEKNCSDDNASSFDYGSDEGLSDMQRSEMEGRMNEKFETWMKVMQLQFEKQLLARDERIYQKLEQLVNSQHSVEDLKPKIE